MNVLRIRFSVTMGAAILFGISCFLGSVSSAEAVLYAPGATLDPTCLPTDPICGVQSAVATGTAGQIGYYATTGGVISPTSSLVTTATSTFAGLNIASRGLRVATLNASNCDLKATTDGTLYCGVDVSAGSPMWGSIAGTLSSQTDLWTILDPKLSTTTLGLFDKGFFYSTSSANYLLSTYDKGFFFSTTSANYWEGTQVRWATSSADYFIGTKLALPNLGTLSGLASFGSSSAMTTALGDLTIMGSATTSLNFAAGGIFFVKSGGNVGVGSTSPFTTLAVNGTIYGRGWNFFGTSPTGVTGTANIVLSGSPTITNPSFALARGGSLNTSNITLQATNNSAPTTGGNIVFQPYVNFEAARFISTGNFGIGSTSPWSRLVLSATSSNSIVPLLSLETPTPGALATSTVFTIDAYGKVGIGTSTASAFLNVLGTTEQLRLGYDNANFASFTVNSGGAMTITTPSSITMAGTALISSVITTTSTADSANFAARTGTGISNRTLAQLLLPGATTSDVRITFRGSSNGPLTANSNYSSLLVGQQAVTEAASGNHPILTQLGIRPLSITAGAATVDNTATLYIEDAASTTVVGTGNYALWVDNGTSRFDGNVGIGTSSPATALDVNGTITQLAQKGCSTGLTTDALGSINGCVASDERLKKNIEPLTSSLDILDKLSPVTYEWKDENRDTQTHAGFIAQEVEKILPQAVVSAGNGFKGVDPNAIIALVVRTIQDLAQSITTVVLNATTVNTHELCVDGTCVTGDQLRHLLQQSNQQSVSTIVTTPSVVQPTTVSSDTSTTTEVTSTESVSTTPSTSVDEAPPSASSTEVTSEATSTEATQP